MAVTPSPVQYVASPWGGQPKEHFTDGFPGVLPLSPVDTISPVSSLLMIRGRELVTSRLKALLLFAI